MAGDTGQRRPIKAREFAASQAVAHFLSVRGVSPNGISLFGLACAVTAGMLLAFAAPGAFWPWLFAALLIEGRLLCNMFDGMVAIERAVASKLGELYNEVPDRIADIAVLVGLGYAPGGAPWLGYVAALAAVFTAYVRVLGVSLGAPADFSGLMAKPYRMQTVALASVICAAATLIGASYETVIGSFGVPALALAVIAFGSITTSLRRLIHLAAHLR